jgi:cephalosporin hydroxylase
MGKLSPLERFKLESIERVKANQQNKALKDAMRNLSCEIIKANAGYNFFYLGVPIVQSPEDLHALQEIAWETKPNLIIETGIAWGGSVIFSASILTILESCGVIENGQVLGIDVEIRPHNREAITAHPMGKKIAMLEGSSIDKGIVEQVRQIAEDKRVMVCLDSNHTHEHVLAELEAYGPLVSKGCYCMVGDTGVEDTPEELLASGRPWGKGNNPKTAVREFLKRLRDRECIAADGDRLTFEVDGIIENKLFVTSAPGGYLRRV